MTYRSKWMLSCLVVVAMLAPSVWSKLAYSQEKKQGQEKPLAPPDAPKTLPPSFPTSLPTNLGLPSPTTRKRRRRRRRRRKPTTLPSPTKLTLRELIDELNRKDWEHQAKVLDEIAKKGKKGHQALYKAFQSHKKLRVRLVSLFGLARLKDKRPIPQMIAWANAWWDHPMPLLTGAFLSYGSLARPALIKALKTTSKPHFFLRALSMMQDPALLPFLRQHLQSQNTAVQKLAKQALLQYPDKVIMEQIDLLLKAKVSSLLRSQLFRIATFRNEAKAFPVLIKGMQDSNSSIQFLARLSLEDKAEQVYKALPKQVTAPPRGLARKDFRSWIQWWSSNQRVITEWYVNKQSQQLASVPLKDPKNTVLVYRTLHPMFSYGRMPILVHDVRNKKPKAPQKGKIWTLALPSKKFAALLKDLQASKFAQWPQKMGYIRDITVVRGDKSRRVSIGMIRYLPFEKMEREFIRLSSKLKLVLHYKDYYKRKDDADVVKDGHVGLWAFRDYDQMTLQEWTPANKWKPLADLEGLFGTLKDVVRYMPGRTRLIYLDILETRMRFSSLLYGSRSQSRYTRDGLGRSRRMQDFVAQGIGVTYLMTDKIEQMIFDFKRRYLPFTSRFAKPTGKRIPLLPALTQVFQHNDIKLLKLSIEPAKIHRLFVRFKARDMYTSLIILARLAMISAGDRVLRYRVNQSGEADRDKFPVIIQLQWEMEGPIAPPKQAPSSLQLDKRPNHSMFVPVYR